MSEAVALPTFTIRPAMPDHENFIFSTWLRNYKHSSHFARHIGSPVYFKYHKAIVARILARATVRVCAPPDDNVTIFGYSVTEPGVVHFVYVKKAFRQLGIGASLLDGVGPSWVFTHATDDWHWLHKRFPTMAYNPYLI